VVRASTPLFESELGRRSTDCAGSKNGEDARACAWAPELELVDALLRATSACFRRANALRRRIPTSDLDARAMLLACVRSTIGASSSAGFEKDKPGVAVAVAVAAVAALAALTENYEDFEGH